MTSMILGRKTIALKSGSDEVELNVVGEITHSYIKQTDPAPKKNNKTPKSDGGTTIDRAIEMTCVVSSSFEILALTRTSARDKLNQLIEWQVNQSTVSLLGYGTDGILAKVIEMLPEFLQFRPKPFGDQFMGTSLDEIENLEVKDVIILESREFGDDFGVTLTLTPQIKVPQVSTGGATPSAGKTSKKETPTPQPKQNKSFLKGLTE